MAGAPSRRLRNSAPGMTARRGSGTVRLTRRLRQSSPPPGGPCHPQLSASLVDAVKEGDAWQALSAPTLVGGATRRTFESWKVQGVRLRGQGAPRAGMRCPLREGSSSTRETPRPNAAHRERSNRAKDGRVPAGGEDCLRRRLSRTVPPPRRAVRRGAEFRSRRRGPCRPQRCQRSSASSRAR
jgi:hypothetical protein